MKKKFLEPEIVRIDIKMTENIATSGAAPGEVVNDYAYGEVIMFIITAKINSKQCFEILVDSGQAPNWTHNPGGGFKVDTDETRIALANGCYRFF